MQPVEWAGKSIHIAPSCGHGRGIFVDHCSLLVRGLLHQIRRTTTRLRQVLFLHDVETVAFLTSPATRQLILSRLSLFRTH